MQGETIVKESIVKKPKIFTIIFIISALITAFFSIFSLINPSALAKIMTFIQTLFATQYGWMAMLIPVICMGFLVVLGISKYGKIVIGGKDAKPDYNLFSWLAMLFTSSIGIGIIYFGVNEPLYAYYLAPSSTEAPNVMEAAREAMGTALYHWGVSVWAIFSVVGLVMAYFVSKHNIRYLPGDVIEKSFGRRKWVPLTKNMMNVLAIVCSAMTIAATMGLGSVQISTGINQVINTGSSLKGILPYFVLFLLLIVCFFASTTKKVGKGMQVLGDWNVYLAIAILVFAMLFGPTRYILNQVVQLLGTYIDQLIPRNFDMFLFSNDLTYSTTWDVANNMWWISWTPFMGVFIASISKGRTIRQFAFATMTIPVIFMLFWHAAFGGIALLDAVLGTGNIAKNALESPEVTFFAILETMPWSKLTSIATIVLLIMFISTTVTSAALSLARMTDIEGKEAAPVRSAVWVILMTIIALTGIFSTTLGGNDALNAVKSLATTLSYPYLFFFILMITAFIKQLMKDKHQI
ncbi:BCCT family transporter [Bacillus sp. DTU_2020_1000418_1_SI_GHA_SEK_038]|uniref:BCCT family transporter n=1 Tax=Bacillus sp. DTU_2020_1000418_1_SI_GHA_SEK_038 TaxID=3077585 RepID=UPI0028E4FEF5|nr:BCCT family transporter [Bacillus sp. DTU_2020_1000418_1_SI_GHA_SEK_038]WNS74892.1 BCCT family transporter [Bacillus sp. DTU_2020_1000418_1_SI_GHA_SEK_038]